MFVRLTFCKFSPDRLHKVRMIYNGEIVPEVKKQKGNLGIKLLEPMDRSNDFISISEWKTMDDAIAYESSGTYRRLVSMLEPYLTKQPELKTYTVEQAMVRMDHL
jgi:quinol monooxygenase YgiN